MELRFKIPNRLVMMELYIRKQLFIEHNDQLKWIEKKSSIISLNYLTKDGIDLITTHGTDASNVDTNVIRWLNLMQGLIISKGF